MNKKLKITFFILYILLMGLIIGIKIASINVFQDVHDWNYNEIKKIDKSSADYSFIVIGDNKNSITTFSQFIDEMNNYSNKFVINLGDIVVDGERNKYNFFLDQIEDLSIPMLTVIGNHELMDDGRGNWYEIFGMFYYSFTINDSYFIILDNANGEYLDDAQKDWLISELNTSQEYQNRFVFMHYPLYDPQAEPGEIRLGLKNQTEAQLLNDLYDENNITMLFCSHIHSFYEGMWNDTPYMISGGGGAELGEFAGNNPEHDFYHFIKVTVSNSEDTVQYDVIKLDTPAFSVISRAFHTLWIYIYAFIAISAVTLIIEINLIFLAYYIVFTKKKWLIWNVNHKKTNDNNP